MIQSVVKDTKQVMPVSTYLDGEYGHSDVTIGVPAVIGKNGVEKIHELALNQNEKEWFDKGVNSVKSALAGIDI
jgi:malate dehydrogenase